MNRTILLIEDDIELSELIAGYLQNKGFDVSVENDGGPAAERIISEQPDLVIVDLMLPNQDGISICKTARQYFNGFIMMLTASTDDFDQVVALEIGVDDFVQKPIEPRVLLARINALFRRAPSLSATPVPVASQPQAKTLSFRALTINLSARKVTLDGEPISLNTPEFDTLCYMAERAGEIIDRQTLFRALKNLDYDGQNRFVDITISQIRKKFGDQADNYLQTVRGKGYLFVVE